MRPRPRQLRTVAQARTHVDCPQRRYDLVDLWGQLADGDSTSLLVGRTVSKDLFKTQSRGVRAAFAHQAIRVARELVLLGI